LGNAQNFSVVLHAEIDVAAEPVEERTDRLAGIVFGFPAAAFEFNSYSFADCQRCLKPIL
jgi:hypothetical protein